MSTTKKTSGGFTALMAGIAIVVALIIGIVTYMFIFGNPENFVDKDPTQEPLDGNFLGIIYKGGFIVPMLVAMVLIVIIFFIERLVTLAMAGGKGSTDKFVERIREHLHNNEIDAAIEACDQQRGSLANVVRTGLEKYKQVSGDASMTKEQKIEDLKKELEEATSLELPMLSKNLGVLSTSASISTLIGLIGTVLGMIRAFAAMSHGTPDTSALATGISEALINTAFGITASTMAIIFYNLFSTKVDSMTYAMDEASFSIVQDFSAKHK